VLNLKTNNLTNPLGIAAGAPRQSWQLDGTRRGTT
jgi:alpha-L-rhamnosidase